METEVNIEKVLRKTLAHHNAEVSRITKMLALCNGHDLPKAVAYTTKKTKAVKPLNTAGKKVGVVHWEKPLKKLFKENENKALTVKEIVNALFKGSHAEKRATLRTRLSVSICGYEKEGWIKANRSEDGKGFITYHLS